MQITFSERELEDFLCTDKNLKKYLGLEFIARQVNIAPAGIIDILAYSKESKCFVIIELKKDLLDLNALVQGISYLKYYQDVRKFNYVHRNRTRNFALLLVGQNLDSSLIKIIDHKGYDETFNDNQITYNLFEMDFGTGINFGCYTKPQSNYSDLIMDLISAREGMANKQFNTVF